MNDVKASPDRAGALAHAIRRAPGVPAERDRRSARRGPRSSRTRGSCRWSTLLLKLIASGLGSVQHDGRRAGEPEPLPQRAASATGSRSRARRTRRCEAASPGRPIRSCAPATPDAPVALARDHDGRADRGPPASVASADGRSSSFAPGLAPAQDPAFDVGTGQPTTTLRGPARHPRAYAAVPLVSRRRPRAVRRLDRRQRSARRSAGRGSPRAVHRVERGSRSPPPSSASPTDGVATPTGTGAVGRRRPRSTPTPTSGRRSSRTWSRTISARSSIRTRRTATRGMMNVLGGSYVLFGDRDNGATTTRTYAPDPSSASPTAARDPLVQRVPSGDVAAGGPRLRARA
jgi:hypothetical protein